jgi:hypothetical protein
MKTIPEIIEEYSKRKIFIEVLADAYKLEGAGICWRAYVHYLEDGVWIAEDLGCTIEWEKAFNICVRFIESYFKQNND